MKFWPTAGDFGVFVRTGTVIDGTSWREVTGMSTSGSAITHGSIGMSSVSSSTSVRSESAHKLFLLQKNGSEIELNFTMDHFGFRPGHELSLAYVHPRKQDGGYLLTALNHTTNNHKVSRKAVRRAADDHVSGLTYVGVPTALAIIICIGSNYLKDFSPDFEILGDLSLFFLLGWWFIGPAIIWDWNLSRLRKPLLAMADKAIAKARSHKASPPQEATETIRFGGISVSGGADPKAHSSDAAAAQSPLAFAEPANARPNGEDRLKLDTLKLSDDQQAALRQLETLAHIFDGAIEVPGFKGKRVGADPLLGLILDL
jgi:hypothetical protein